MKKIPFKPSLALVANMYAHNPKRRRTTKKKSPALAINSLEQ
jgi:hypothetical protein